MVRDWPDNNDQTLNTKSEASSDQSDEAFDSRIRLIQEYGSMEKIPKEILDKKKLHLFYNPKDEKKVYSLIPKPEYEKKRGQCLSFLENYKGYLFVSHLSDIRGFLNGAKMISDATINEIMRRSERFKELNIPPIFKSEFYLPGKKFSYLDLPIGGGAVIEKERDLFPNTDFIIQYATGAFHRKLAAMAIKLEKILSGRAERIPIQPATAQDVLDFRQVAFIKDGEQGYKIHPVLIRDTLYYVQTHFAFKDRQALYPAIFAFLENKLQDLKVEPIKYKHWDGNMEIVKEPRWYLQFSEEDIQTIAESYFRSVTSKPTGRDLEFFKKMQSFFPNMAEGLLELLEANKAEKKSADLEQIIREAEENQDFSQVPISVFKNSVSKDKFLPRLKKFFTDHCTKLLTDNPAQFFETIDSFFTCMPPTAAMIPELNKIFWEFRLIAVEKLTDDQFNDVFIKSKEEGGHHFIIGGSKPGKEEPLKKQIRDYVTDRRNRILSTPK